MSRAAPTMGMTARANALAAIGTMLLAVTAATALLVFVAPLLG